MTEDPLKKLPAQEEMLFNQFTKLADGKDLDAVMGASINMLVNAIRMTAAKRRDAEAKYDEITGTGKQLLLHNHYDSVTGLRRNVFPHTQILHAPHHIDDDVLMGRKNGG